MFSKKLINNDLFSDDESLEENQPLENRETSDSIASIVDKDVIKFVGSLVLRHITQLICNASAIYEGILAIVLYPLIYSNLDFSMTYISMIFFSWIQQKI